MLGTGKTFQNIVLRGARNAMLQFLLVFSVAKNVYTEHWNCALRVRLKVSAEILLRGDLTQSARLFFPIGWLTAPWIAKNLILDVCSRLGVVAMQSMVGRCTDKRFVGCRCKRGGLRCSESRGILLSDVQGTTPQFSSVIDAQKKSKS